MRLLKCSAKRFVSSGVGVAKIVPDGERCLEPSSVNLGGNTFVDCTALSSAHLWPFQQAQRCAPFSMIIIGAAANLLGSRGENPVKTQSGKRQNHDASGDYGQNYPTNA